MKALPQAMLKAKRWMLWREVLRQGKIAKVPYYADGSPRSKTDTPKDAARLASYAEALKVYEAAKDQYKGLAFALGDGWQGLDLDGVRDPATGTVAPWAHELVEQAASYAEVSPSGKGLHVIGHGADLDNLNNNGSGVELYAKKRYFTVTGQTYNGNVRKLADLNAIYPKVRERHGSTERTKEFKPAAPVTPGITPIDWVGNKREAQAILKNLDPDMTYGDWVTVGMVLYNASGGHPDALAMWDAWSARGAKYASGVCTERWAGFKDYDGPRVSMGSLVHMERQAKKPTPAPDSEGGGLKIEVVEDLLDQDFPPPEEVFSGALTLTPGAHLLTGKPKRGKSWLAMGLAVAACTGERYVDSAVAAPMQALYVACDDPSRARFANRVKAFRPAAKLTGLGLITSIEDNAASVLELIGEFIKAQPGVRFVVIDTLSAFRERQRTESPYQQEYDELKAINDWAHKHNIVVLVVHHLRKGAVDTQDPFESISGTLGLQGAVDGMMVLERKDLDSDKDEALDEKLAALWHRQRDIEEYDLGMKLEDGRWHVMGRATDVFHAGTQREILNVLEGEPGVWMTSKEIHSKGSFDCKAASVQKAASRMAKKGLIESHRGALDGKAGGGGAYRAVPK